MGLIYGSNTFWYTSISYSKMLYKFSGQLVKSCKFYSTVIGNQFREKYNPPALMLSLPPLRHAALSRDIEATPNTSQTNYIRLSNCLDMHHHNICISLGGFKWGKLLRYWAPLLSAACLSGGRDRLHIQDQAKIWAIWSCNIVRTIG